MRYRSWRLAKSKRPPSRSSAEFGKFEAGDIPKGPRTTAQTCKGYPGCNLRRSRRRRGSNDRRYQSGYRHHCRRVYNAAAYRPQRVGGFRIRRTRREYRGFRTIGYDRAEHFSGTLSDSAVEVPRPNRTSTIRAQAGRTRNGKFGVRRVNSLFSIRRFLIWKIGNSPV